MSLIKAVAVAACLALAAISSASGEDTGPRVAFFGFRLINTSLEPTTAAEERRLHQLDQLLREKLGASGRFRIVAIPPELQKAAAAGPDIGDCNGCERALAKKIDTDLAAWGTVQKVSNLILNINLYMEDVQTGKLLFVQSVDIRGNTDESWQRGLSYMLRHYLFGEP